MKQMPYGQLFRVNIIELDGGEAAVAENDDLSLWHKPFGHTSKQRLVKMAATEDRSSRGPRCHSQHPDARKWGEAYHRLQAMPSRQAVQITLWSEHPTEGSKS